ncbi:flagellar assembly protein A [Clostridium gasigenes]|uniref:flagellar assembly protein A n=1 Tax=Clostridium gasigenes TaxID=94869 RepID=UPI001C0D2433|nr:flagellar assembly protein A [Clostridium gasigenes]MBU3109083.1 FapA family protein [Clostridium gasigenes]
MDKVGTGLDTNDMKTNDIENLNGTVEVKNGKIIVKNPIGSGEYAKVISNNDCKLLVNGKKISETSIVKENDEIVFDREEIKGKRHINIKTNVDNTEARVSINYETGFRYEIKDAVENNVLTLEHNEVSGELPPLFTVTEIINYLHENKIIMGIKQEEIKLIEQNRDIKDFCVAASTPAEEPVQDKIKFVYNANKDEEDIDTMRKIDYKNKIFIESVKKGDVIAEIIKGSLGKEGISIYGKKIKNKPVKALKFKVGSGCSLEENKILATIDGKISVGKNIFQVNKLHTVNGDVDIKSGNINFHGDVKVNGKVTEGMNIVANSINVVGGTFKANIKVSDSSIILGNTVNTQIKIGGQDLLKQKKAQELLLLKEQLQSLLENIIFLKEKKLIDENLTDGYLVKTLIESKYKTIPKNCTAIIGIELANLDGKSELISIIRKKLIGVGPINIKKYTEIEEIIEVLNNEMELLEIENTLSKDLIIEYCQEADIEVIGNVSIVGKGSYISKIFAMGNIEFTGEKSQCKGGHLKADELIKVNIVGNEVGVGTKLQVEKNGHIYADVAYENTIFIVGKRKHVLLKDAKDVHVYNDKNGEIIVDKLYL